MRISLPVDLLSTAFETRMAMHAHSINTVRSTTSLSNMMNSNNNSLNDPNNASNDRRHIVDILVGVIAVPVLILFALQLEKNLQNMTNSPWLVFVLGVGLLMVILIIIGYVTHRLSVCRWTGPISLTIVPQVNAQNDVLGIEDTLPPSYDSVVRHELPPPSYDCIINLAQCKEQQAAAVAAAAQAEAAGKELPSSAAVLHI